jgi:carbon starvation protein
MVKQEVPFGMIALVVMGVLAGQMTYKWKQNIMLTTVVTVALTFVGIWVGTLPAVSGIFSALYGGAESPVFFLGNTQAAVIGTLLMIVFCYLGAVLPIWSFAQPVNYLSFWIVTLGMVGGVIGLVIWHPGMGDFPAFTGFTTAIGPLWPMLFVTIACGAISGWHSLVSTSGTARQLEKETDALPVGGGAMFMEAGFAIVAFLTATVGFGSYQGFLDAGGALAVFAGGLASFLNHIGVPLVFGTAYGSVFLVIMAITIMQLVVRFMRVASAEMLGDSIPVMKNVHVGSIVALALTLLFVWVIPWLTIWVAFGASNQLMAGLALLLVSLWLMSEGRKHAWALYPAIFMIVTTIAALGYVAFTNLVTKLPAALAGGNTQGAIASGLIGLICVVLVVAALVLIVDGWQAIQRAQKEAPAKT